MSYGSRDNCACPSFSDVLTKKYAQTQARVVELGTCIQRVPRVQYIYSKLAGCEKRKRNEKTSIKAVIRSGYIFPSI